MKTYLSCARCLPYTMWLLLIIDSPESCFAPDVEKIKNIYDRLMTRGGQQRKLTLAMSRK